MKRKLVYDFIHRRCQEEPDSLRQKVEQWLPGTRGGRLGVSVRWGQSLSLERWKSSGDRRQSVMVKQNATVLNGTKLYS